MTGLAERIKYSEAALVSRILYYAEKTGYAKHTPSDENVWKLSVRGFSEGILSALSNSPELPELSPDIHPMQDKMTAFGVLQARKHRSRGVTLEMFLGLMKYFRQSYHDIIDEHTSPLPDVRSAHIFVERYFDKIEIGFISEWERYAAELKSHHEKLLLDRNSELSAANARLKQEIIERKRAEQKITRLNIDLEKRVAVRTLQLQRINEQNNFKLKELQILNRLSSLNLAKIRLNGFTAIILEALTSNAPYFFDRALLFLFNERTQVLQGMLGVEREKKAAENGGKTDEKSIALESDLSAEAASPLNRMLRSCRLELKKGKGSFYLAVAEKRIIAGKTQPGKGQEVAELCSCLNLEDYAVMPLMGNAGIFGVVVVDNPLSAKKISRSDLRFLRLFANHAGIAIQNLMLYTSLEDSNRKFQEAQEQLIHGARLATIGEMSASIAHDLKGPLIAIGGFARRLAKKIPADSIEAGYVATIVEEEQRLENMLDEVLLFSKKTTICYEICSVIDTVENSLAILSHIFQMNRVILSRSYPKNAINLYADCQQLKQVFINIFQNALDVMCDGGELRVTIAPSRIGKERAVAIKIADTGGGISESLRNSIFTPFFTTKKNGTGLGLPIANRIVSNHGGKIKVRNHPGGGAEFAVILPCQEEKLGL